jgi:hypothetical protein
MLSYRYVEVEIYPNIDTVMTDHLPQQTWAELATEVKDIGQQRIDITTIKMVMKPVQRAVKDVSKSISDSPLYHSALRYTNTNTNTSISTSTSTSSSFGGHASPQSLAPPFQGGTGYQPNFTASLNTALAQSIPLGPPTSVPATPLAAALGPAAQATLSYAPQAQGEYFPSHSVAGSNVSVRGMHDRLDTMIQHPVGGGHNQQYATQQPQQHNNYAGQPHTARRVDMNRQ